MNWRRLPGIRECFVPRPGNVFIQADYSGLELCTLAQACIDILGGSDLAEAINAGLDAHTAFAADILGISYEEGERRRKLDKESDPIAKAFDDARQTAKVANFGFPGGLGYEKLCLFARKTYNVVLTPSQAKDLKAAWFKKWPEMPYYFQHVNELGDALEQLRSKRIRAGASYTAKCNSYFQGLGADAAKAAGWMVSKACYLGEAPRPEGAANDWRSPLYGCRIGNFVHDEIIGEAKLAIAAEAAEELSRLMVLGAQPWIPDIKLVAEPCLMSVWSKNAKTLRDEKGRLIPWAPKEAA
jgi:DNA polymerase-1